MHTAKPGIALRNLRKSNRWTLLDVSKKTGVPASTLSRIENDQISPTYDLLLRLSRGLALDLTQLLSIDGDQRQADSAAAMSVQPGRRSVNRKKDGDVVPMSNHTLRYLSTDLLNKQITPIMCEYHARTLEEFGDFMRHDGEEFLYVVEGELELHTECYSPLVLAAGESTYFDSRMGHAYLARGDAPCRALSICTVAQTIAKPISRTRTQASEIAAEPTSPRRRRARRAG